MKGETRGVSSQKCSQRTGGNFPSRGERGIKKPGLKKNLPKSGVGGNKDTIQGENGGCDQKGKELAKQTNKTDGKRRRKEKPTICEKGGRALVDERIERGKITTFCGGKLGVGTKKCWGLNARDPWRGKGKTPSGGEKMGTVVHLTTPTSSPLYGKGECI